MAASGPSVLARRAVLYGSSVLGLLGLYWIGRSFVVDGRFRFGNPVSTLLAQEVRTPVAPPISVRAEVTRTNKKELVRLGQACEFLVEQRQREQGSYYCNAQVVCGEKLLYGGADRGYFPCRFFEGARRDVVGNDPTTTRQDKDAAMRLDTRAGILHVWDDEAGVHGAFDIEAEIISAH